MQLPINIYEILNGQSVEWARLEFKKGWNPEKVIRTLCAFANDFQNLGGGYIVLGVEEKEGLPVLPPCGLPLNQIDQIQKELLSLCHKILPHYHPIIAPCQIEDNTVLVIWAFGGQNRPYKAPVSLKKENHDFAYFIRKGASTVKASAQDELELLSLGRQIPFDDRINRNAELSDINLGLIRSFLQNVKSDLFDESAKMNFTKLCRLMNIVEGPKEATNPKNAGILFFNETPDKFFPQTQIDIVHFPEGPASDTFSEKILKGPIHIMLKDALAHIRSQVIMEKIIKNSERPEATRVFNYAFVAIEEALCNALYHRSYEIREPIEVRILPDQITISSFPGPDHSISEEDIKNNIFNSRRYRNRRVGEFLKELEMTEGRGTGIPKIYQECKKNDSPFPTFKTDQERTYFAVIFPIHPAFLKPDKPISGTKIGTKSGTKMGLSRDQVEILTICLTDSTIQELMVYAKKSNRTKFRHQTLNPLIEAELLEMTIPDKPNSKLQKYRLTQTGKEFNLGLALEIEKDADLIDLNTPKPVEQNEAHDEQKKAHDAEKRAHDEVKEAHDEQKKAHVEKKEAPVKLVEVERELLKALQSMALGRIDLQIALGNVQRSGNFKKIMKRMLDAKFIEYTIPSKPKSRQQKYQITSKGRHILEATNV